MTIEKADRRFKPETAQWSGSIPKHSEEAAAIRQAAATKRLAPLGPAIRNGLRVTRIGKVAPTDSRRAEAAQTRKKVGLGTAGVGYLMASRGKDVAPGIADLFTRSEKKIGEAKHTEVTARRAARIGRAAGKVGAATVLGGLALGAEGLASDVRHRHLVGSTKETAKELMMKSAFGVEDERLIGKASSGHSSNARAAAIDSAVAAGGIGAVAAGMKARRAAERNEAAGRARAQSGREMFNANADRLVSGGRVHGNEAEFMRTGEERIRTGLKTVRRSRRLARLGTAGIAAGATAAYGSLLHAGSRGVSKAVNPIGDFRRGVSAAYRAENRLRRMPGPQRDAMTGAVARGYRRELGAAGNRQAFVAGARLGGRVGATNTATRVAAGSAAGGTALAVGAKRRRSNAFDDAVAKAYTPGEITYHQSQADMHARKKASAGRGIKAGTAMVAGGVAAGGLANRFAPDIARSARLAVTTLEPGRVRRAVGAVGDVAHVRRAATLGGLGIAATGAGVVAGSGVRRAFHAQRQNAQAAQAQAARRRRTPQLSKAFDPERSRHGRQSMYEGAASGGAVVAGGAGVAAARRAGARSGASSRAAASAAANRSKGEQRLIRMVGRGNGSMPRTDNNLRGTINAFNDAKTQGQRATKLAGEARRLRRVSGGAIAGSALLGATALGIHRHDRRGAGRTYGY